MTVDTSNTLATLSGEGGHTELINGTLVTSPPPTRVHQTVVMHLLLEMARVLPDGFLVRSGPLEVRYSDDTVLQPDIVVVPAEGYDDEASPLRPLLAVEVLSPSSRERDLGVKKAAYKAAGCPSYWVFDPEETLLVGWDLIDGEYVEVLRGTGADWVTAVRPIVVTLIPEALLRASAPGLFEDD